MAKVIDAHIHFADDDPTFLDLLEQFDLRLLNICYAASYEDDWRKQRTLYSSMQHEYPARFAWCTTFDLPHTDDADFDPDAYGASVIAQLEQDFAAGAVACKAWKNIGMTIRKRDGSFLQIDDELFTPIFSFLAVNGHPLLMHMAEPLACWQPLDERSPHYNYYSTHPQWHMYNHPEHPSHSVLIAARDHMVEQNPNLRIVGAHLGSLEYDVDEVAARFERFPNFAVDISARLGDMALQDSGKVRDFMLRYSDRILFGTDVVMRQQPSELPEEERAKVVGALRAEYETHFTYFETTEEMTVRGIETVGLGLPEDVLERFYRGNALSCYPGLQALEQ